ncbi:MAG: DUF1566 domain-containing protein [Paludibacteraceae bacterium]|nr:DUF1566 domain-containing protein [Paludibacteraceae bacterium]
MANDKLNNVLSQIETRKSAKAKALHEAVLHVDALASDVAFLDSLRKQIIELTGIPEESIQTMRGVKIEDAKGDVKLRSGLITVFDKNGNRSFVTPEDYKAGKYPLDEYTPEAVTVRRKDGTTFMEISLVNMSCNHPEAGLASNESEARMPFGGYGEHVEGLTQYGKDDERGQVLIDRENNLKGHGRYGYIASGKFANEDGDKSTDPDKRYFYADNDSYLPLSRKADGTPNPLFGEGISKPSFLADGVNFEANNKALLAMATAQENWRTAAEITCKADKGYYPAACCCARYKTAHYDDWGLPTAEDLAIAFEDWDEVQSALKAVAAIAPNLAVPLGEGYRYWSSSEGSEYAAYFLYTFNGDMYFDGKNDGSYVRAFRLLRI